MSRPNWEVVGRSKLRVDARKWIASKLLPKKYGEKVTREHTGPDGGAVEVRHGIVALNFDAINKRREQIAAETSGGVDATVRTIG